jgi:hypothetical protein
MVYQVIWYLSWTFVARELWFWLHILCISIFSCRGPWVLGSSRDPWVLQRGIFLAVSGFCRRVSHGLLFCLFVYVFLFCVCFFSSVSSHHWVTLQIILGFWIFLSCPRVFWRYFHHYAARLCRKISVYDLFDVASINIQRHVCLRCRWSWFLLNCQYYCNNKILYFYSAFFQ